MELSKHSKSVSKKYRVAEERKGLVLSREYVFKFSYFKELIIVDGKKFKRCQRCIPEDSVSLSQTELALIRCASEGATTVVVLEYFSVVLPEIS